MSLKKYLSPRFLPVITLFCSALAVLLNLLLHNTGYDDRNLLIRGHWAGIALCILSALFFAVLVLVIRPLHKLRYSKLFPPSLPGAIGCWAGAIGIVSISLPRLQQSQGAFSLICAGLALLAALSLILIGVCRLQGKQPFFVLHLLVTLFFMVNLLCQYQIWSAQSQVLLYLFPLLGSVFAMITAYYATCLDADTGSRRWYVFFSQATVFCCCAGLIGSDWIFYLAMAMWNMGDLCTLQTREESL